MLEPWLRGIRLDADPVLAPVLFALQQVREDLRAIEVNDPWLPLPGIPTLGFQLRHIAGSLDRLTTYLEGGELSEDQFAFLARESTPGLPLDRLLEQAERALTRTEDALRRLDPASFAQARHVGRRKLPTTVIGLAIHIAEHTQRHCGQAITTAKLMRASTSPYSPPQPPA
jgi:hypothetical protein